MLGMPDKLPALSLGPEKVHFAWLTEVFYSMLDSLELCQFVWGPGWTLYGPAETVELVKSATGWQVSLDELMAVGMRRLNLMRVFNAREGLDRKADKLPKKFFRKREGTGPTAGITLTHDEVEMALDEYYKFAGWTKQGIPTRDSLSKLDISWASDYLP